MRRESGRPVLVGVVFLVVAVAAAAGAAGAVWARREVHAAALAAVALLAVLPLWLVVEPDATETEAARDGRRPSRRR